MEKQTEGESMKKSFNISFWLAVSIPAFMIYMFLAVIGSIVVANKYNLSWFPTIVIISQCSFLCLIYIAIFRLKVVDSVPSEQKEKK